jgi:hypothetical protein
VVEEIYQGHSLERGSCPTWDFAMTIQVIFVPNMHLQKSRYAFLELSSVTLKRDLLEALRLPGHVNHHASQLMF